MVITKSGFQKFLFAFFMKFSVGVNVLDTYDNYIFEIAVNSMKLFSMLIYILKYFITHSEVQCGLPQFNQKIITF